jgi:hypothetical protein
MALTALITEASTAVGAEEINMNSEPPKVLIVGAGPTGMTAALELSRLQIPMRIIEKMPKPATTSRAVGVQARTLGLLEQRGLVERMLAKGNRGLAGSIYGEANASFGSISPTTGVSTTTCSSSRRPKPKPPSAQPSRTSR